MFWSCYGNCTKGVPDDYRTLYRAAGVTHILGFNEPDNSGQSHLSPAHAAASGFAPPLTLVSPAMTHWTLNGSVWLDEFFGNCSDVVKDCDPSLVKYVAFHDYSASAGGIVAKADAAFQRYGNARRIRCSLTALTTALTTAKLTASFLTGFAALAALAALACLRLLLPEQRRVARNGPRAHVQLALRPPAPRRLHPRARPPRTAPRRRRHHQRRHRRCRRRCRGTGR